MTNMAVEVALKAGCQFVRAKVGDRYVLEELSRHGWLLGGEGSGHLLALDKHTTGDGLISALQVLQACVRSGKTLAELLAGVNLFRRPCSTCACNRAPTGRPTAAWPARSRLWRPSWAMGAGCSSAPAAPSRCCG
jgi:phosphomannomutase